MAGQQRSWRSGGKRRSLRRALLFGAIVRRSHRRGYISARRFYVGTRYLAMGIVGRLGGFAGALRRWSWLLHRHMWHRVGIAIVVGTSCLIQFVGSDNARIFWWTSRAAGDALVLHWQDHRFIIGRWHRPIAGSRRLQARYGSIIHGTEENMKVRLYSRGLQDQE
jgi:hypothetical protein